MENLLHQALKRLRESFHEAIVEVRVERGEDKTNTQVIDKRF